MMEIKKLDFDICSWSSYSTSYLPENIREDNPSNQTSRWSSNTNSPPQFLTLKLPRPAIVKKIKFGKYEKTHVCNLRKFKILGGLEEEHMVLLFEGGLKNDSIPEIFDLRHKTNAGEFLPVKFIQIMPLLSWGPSFNFSIWYVELLGVDDPIFVLASLRNFNMLREIEIVRLCLKHCRQQGYDKTFAALKEETSVYLEDEIMTDLYETLVNSGDFKKTEQMIGDFVEAGLMDQYIARQEYKATWMKQNVNDYGVDDRPGQRGGHQLIIDADSDAGVMYLYGGWDGSEDLSDFWTYDIKTSKWTLIHRKSELLDGPTPRACHKMVFDPCNSQIFVLGRYLDAASRTKENLKSDFYLYDTRSKTWFQISDDTSQVGGPGLIYDHQMCLDSTKNTIFVFGGRVLMSRDDDDMANDFQYSGLFSYHISTNTWMQILVDCAHPLASCPDVLSIKSRVTHSMLFHHKQRKLYIFGGQRGKDYIMEMQTYDVDTQEISYVLSDSNNEATKNVPQSGFTQRATIDCDKNEIYVLTSRSKDKERKDMNVNSFWVYSLNKNEWTCIYKSDHSTGEGCYSKNTNICAEPCPRYAHQLVYDHFNQVHYLFGGNPGVNYPQMRLDDFWALYLEKPSRSNVLRLCQYWIRRQEYEEIAKTDPLKGIHYLQTTLSEIIDHQNAKQLKEFHKLASLLFNAENGPATDEENMMTISLGAFSACNDVDEKASDVVSKKPTDDRQAISFENQNDSNSLVSISSTSSSMSSDFMSKYRTEATQANLGGAVTVGTGTTFNKFKYSGQKFEIKIRRSLLFNKLIEILPEKLNQPKGNLSDFVLV